MRGIFKETPEHAHVRRRAELLGAEGPLRAIEELVGEPLLLMNPDPEVLADELGRQLKSCCVAVVDLVDPLGVDDFVTVGELLGHPQPERAPEVQERVEKGVVLNLATTHKTTAEVGLQPFATGWLSLHSESSGAPLAAQPRLIVLMCLTPGDASAAATVVVPMTGVAASLDAADLELLARTSYADRTGVPPIARQEDGRWAFSLRDFQGDPLAWELGGADAPNGSDASEDHVNAALARLYAAMYSAHAYAATWRRGRLVVIDNRRTFHGRSASVALDTWSRHLQRMRIAAA